MSAPMALAQLAEIALAAPIPEIVGDHKLGLHVARVGLSNSRQALQHAHQILCDAWHNSLTVPPF
jgi:hypothetical protein